MDVTGFDNLNSGTREAEPWVRVGIPYLENKITNLPKNTSFTWSQCILKLRKLFRTSVFGNTTQL